MNIVSPGIIEYVRDLKKRSDPIVDEMKVFSQQEHRPTIGTLGGEYCCQLATMIGAKEIFEVCSSFGYSTLWFARGVARGGHVHFTQKSPEIIDTAKDFLSRAGVANSVLFHEGDGIELLKEADQEFDCILLNCNKDRFAEAMPIVRERLRKGGLLIAVNVFMGGDVCKQSDDSVTQAAQIFNKSLANDPMFQTTINPFRNGISVSLKMS